MMPSTSYLQAEALLNEALSPDNNNSAREKASTLVEMAYPGTEIDWERLGNEPEYKSSIRWQLVQGIIYAREDYAGG